MWKLLFSPLFVRNVGSTTGFIALKILEKAIAGFFVAVAMFHYREHRMRGGSSVSKSITKMRSWLGVKK